MASFTRPDSRGRLSHMGCGTALIPATLRPVEAFAFVEGREGLRFWDDFDTFLAAFVSCDVCFAAMGFPRSGFWCESR
jgi:hypothetical protein